MTWMRRLHPELASPHRMLGAWEGHLAGNPLSRLRSTLRRLAGSGGALRTVLEPWVRILQPGSELASLAFFLLLIALTFVI